MRKSDNIEWIDNLRAFATIGVVVLHVSIAVLRKNQNFASTGWWIANVIESSVRFCVPVFLMISGALLFHKEYILSDFLKKRVLRIIPPLLFWCFIYTLAVLIQTNMADELTQNETSILLNQLISDGVSFHFWYVYLIIGLYLFIPILGKWASLSSNNHIYYFLLIWIATLIFNLFNISSSMKIDLSNFSGYAGYLLAGYYVAKKWHTINETFTLSLLLILIGIITTSVGTYAISKSVGTLIQQFYNYLTPNVLILSCGFFLLFKQIKIDNNRIKIIRDALCKYSFGIYLVHMLVLSVLYKTILSNLLTFPLIGILSISTLCVFVSLTITMVINKIPLIGKYISG